MIPRSLYHVDTVSCRHKSQRNCINWVYGALEISEIELEKDVYAYVSHNYTAKETALIGSIEPQKL